jgi:hypothetical protein
VTLGRTAAGNPAQGAKSRTTSAPVRGTQLLVEHMGEVFRRPSLAAIEIAWRWVVGIPFLLVCWFEAERILAAYPLESSGLYSLDKQNPWVATIQFTGVWAYYKPPVLAILHWLIPAFAMAWAISSGLGRSVLLKRIEPGVRSRPVALVALQAAWVLLFAATVWGWFRCMQWVAGGHIYLTGEPDLIGFSIWAICLTLGFFTVFALVSWVFSIAPILMLMERRSALSAIGAGFWLGKPFASKLTEINLVMGIVKLALMVVAMVFSAAPLPFRDELGPDAMHFVLAGSAIFYLVANDYFQAVRVRAFVEFWKVFRQPAEI